MQIIQQKSSKLLHNSKKSSTFALKLHSVHFMWGATAEIIPIAHVVIVHLC